MGARPLVAMALWRLIWWASGGFIHAAQVRGPLFRAAVLQIRPNLRNTCESSLQGGILGRWARAPFYHRCFGSRSGGPRAPLYLLFRYGARYSRGQYYKIDQKCETPMNLPWGGASWGGGRAPHFTTGASDLDLVGRGRLYTCCSGTGPVIRGGSTTK